MMAETFEVLGQAVELRDLAREVGHLLALLLEIVARAEQLGPQAAGLALVIPDQARELMREERSCQKRTTTPKPDLHLIYRLRAPYGYWFAAEGFCVREPVERNGQPSHP
jgi:hypothetical protein